MHPENTAAEKVGAGGTALIAGASGFIGHRLLQPGDRALVRSASAVAGAVIGNLEAPDSLAAACAEVSTVFHCAGYAHAFASSDPAVHRRINYEGTCNLVEAAGRSAVRSFVFLSSVKAMADPGDACADEEWPGEPDTPYGQAKRAAEEAVLEAGAKYGMHVVNLRLAMVYGRGGNGNLERMARGIRAGWFPPLPETGNRRSLVHVDDVVAAMRLVAERPEANGRTYILAEPRVYSGREIYDALRAALSMPAIGWAVPAAVLKAGGALGDLLGSMRKSSMPLNTEAIGRLLGSACYAPGRIRRELGWEAQIGLDAGLKEMLGEQN